MKDGLDLVDAGDPFDFVAPVATSATSRPQPALQGDPFRDQAIADARSLWRESLPGARGVVRAYLLACGIEIEVLPDVLRFRLDHPYVKKIGGEYQVLHRGPCVLAPIHTEGGEVIGVLQIWVDVMPPHHRAAIVHDGKALAAELVRGSSKAGFVPLVTPKGADTLVLSVSIEAALRAFVARPAELQNAAFWAGADLKNMAGKMRRQKGTRYSGLPDLSDGSGFVAPHWIKRLIFLQEDDAPGVREKLECGLKRSMHFRPGLRASIVRIGASAARKE